MDEPTLVEALRGPLFCAEAIKMSSDALLTDIVMARTSKKLHGKRQISDLTTEGTAVWKPFVQKNRYSGPFPLRLPNLLD